MKQIIMTLLIVKNNGVGNDSGKKRKYYQNKEIMKKFINKIIFIYFFIFIYKIFLF